MAIVMVPGTAGILTNDGAINIGGSQNKGYLIRGPHNKVSNILCSILGSLCLWTLSYRGRVWCSGQSSRSMTSKECAQKTLSTVGASSKWALAVWSFFAKDSLHHHIDQTTHGIIPQFTVITRRQHDRLHMGKGPIKTASEPRSEFLGTCQPSPELSETHKEAEQTQALGKKVASSDKA